MTAYGSTCVAWNTTVSVEWSTRTYGKPHAGSNAPLKQIQILLGRTPCGSALALAFRILIGMMARAHSTCVGT